MWQWSSFLAVAFFQAQGKTCWRGDKTVSLIILYLQTYDEKKVQIVFIYLKTLLLKMSVVSEQMAMLWFYFIIAMV